jgi:hypothetical protein
MSEDTDTTSCVQRQSAPRKAKPFQVRKTHYELDGAKVPFGTPGAVRVTSLTAKWYGYIRKKPVPLRTDDYELAVERLNLLRLEAGAGDKTDPDATMASMLRARARREELRSIIDPLELDERQPERDRRRAIRQKHIPGFVYTLLSENGLVKIGQTIDPDGRMRNFSYYPVKVWPLHMIHTDSMGWVELYLHDLFQKKRERGEWFRLDLADVARVMKVDRVYRKDGDDLAAKFAAFEVRASQSTVTALLGLLPNPVTQGPK